MSCWKLLHQNWCKKNAKKMAVNSSLLSLGVYQYTVQHNNCYCIKGLLCSFPLPFLIFIHSMICLLILKYGPFWQSMVFRYSLRTVGLLVWIIIPYLAQVSSPIICQSGCLFITLTHFHFVLQNHWTNFNKTWHKASLG